MSRVTTPPMAQPTTQTRIPHEQIAKRAYEKWVKRGQPHGTDMQDWAEAEAELRAEMSRSPGQPQMATASTGQPHTMTPPQAAQTRPPQPQPQPTTRGRR